MTTTKKNHCNTLKKYLHKINTTPYPICPDKTLVIIIDMYKYIYYYCSNFVENNPSFKTTFINKIPELINQINNKKMKPSVNIYTNFITITNLVLDKYN
mgnify:CR=1 FL=1